MPTEFTVEDEAAPSRCQLGLAMFHGGRAPNYPDCLAFAQRHSTSESALDFYRVALAGKLAKGARICHVVSPSNPQP